MHVRGDTAPLRAQRPDDAVTGLPDAQVEGERRLARMCRAHLRRAREDACEDVVDVAELRQEERSSGGTESSSYGVVEPRIIVVAAGEREKMDARGRLFLSEIMACGLSEAGRSELVEGAQRAPSSRST